MRFAAAISKVVLWLATTVALAVAVPAAWTQLHVVDADGYAAMAQKAARDPALQSAMAAELSARALALVAARGGGHYPVDSSQVHDAVAAFTAGPSFPPLFAQANRAAHAWLFTDARPDQNSNQWLVDVAPMFNDSSIQQQLRRYDVKVPATVMVPITVPSIPESLRQGQLSRLSTWGPWVSTGAAAVSGFCASLMLVAARRRGKTLTGLGVSVLLIGAAGWAGIEIGGRYVNDALNRTTGDIRRIADVMVSYAEASLHQWFDFTLIAGAALVVLGVLVAMLGSLFKKSVR